MKYKILLFTTVISIFFQSFKSFSQCNTYNIAKVSEITSTCSVLPMTMIHDINGLNYLYVANKEAGLRIYDISQLTTPVLVKNIPISAMGNMEAMNLTQQGNYLYLALGNHFNATQNAGMAIVDVSTPANAVLKDFWELPSSGGGSGIIKTEGNYAYLGAMKFGLVVLDISDKSDIKFVSQFIPNINYPTKNPNPNLYNARGMEVKNDIVYLCYDAGGIRIINVTNKSKPVETGRFSNPDLNGKPRAYNNVVLDDTLLYVAVDYCGLEILNIKDSSKIKISGKWNPYNCPASNWFTSPVHANEIQFNKNCKTLFLSVGKTDMISVDVSDISYPDSCNYYGGASNDIGTWGLGIYENQIYLSYVCSVIPFSSNWSGIKILSYTPCTNSIDKNKSDHFLISPNPGNDIIDVFLNKYKNEKHLVNIYNSKGKLLFNTNFENSVKIDIKQLNSGIFYFKVLNLERNEYSIQKFLKL
ncbi:MAG: T9SS type A sorting domain-containing protein [Bacteroidia bacterium]|nr:T9SS type A sorting domain-containing protein [Bacteroidia bacterium]